MAKAIQVFNGTNTFGIPLLLAQREDGKWFVRQKVKHPKFGWKDGQWEPYDGEIEHPTKLRNLVEAGGVEEYSTLTSEQSKMFIKWGFNVLEKQISTSHYRLPSIALE